MQVSPRSTVTMVFLVVLGMVLMACRNVEPTPTTTDSTATSSTASPVADAPTATTADDTTPTSAANPTVTATSEPNPVTDVPIATWGNSEIYVIRPDDTGEQRLTSGPERDQLPKWSPDGQVIAFARYAEGQFSLHLMHADGTGQRLLTDIGGERYAWSPDGTTIAVTTTHGFDGGYPEIYLVAVDGSGARRLTSPETVPTDTYYMGSGNPAWSPDGTRIAFTAEREGGSDIYMFDLSSGIASRIGDLPGMEVEPVWSPDGNWLAFHAFEGGHAHIVIASADGAEQRVLTDGEVTDTEPTWSPDGQRIAFVRYLDSGRQIHMIDVEGGHPRNLSNNAHDEFAPRWSPDGAWITFVRGTGSADHSRQDNDLFVMRPDGSEVWQLTSAPEGSGGMEPDWSPDGSRIVFTSTRDGGQPAQCSWGIAVSLAQATSIEALAWMSHVVVVGTVTEQLPPAFGALEYNTAEPRAPIYTDYIVMVEQQYRGHPHDTVRVRLYGGTIGDCQQTFGPQPELPVGSTLLLFLSEARPDTMLPAAYEVVAGPQGAWTVEDDGTVSILMPYIDTYTGLPLADVAELIRAALRGAPPHDAWSPVPLEEAPATP